jgi:hypothetical protein
MQDDQVPDDVTVLEHGVKYHEMADEHCDQKRYSHGVFKGGSENITAFLLSLFMLSGLRLGIAARSVTCTRPSRGRVTCRKYRQSIDNCFN